MPVEDPWISQQPIWLERGDKESFSVALCLEPAEVTVLVDGICRARFDRDLVRTWLTASPSTRGLLAAADLSVCWWFAAELDVVVVLLGTGQYQLPPAAAQLVLAEV